MPTAASRTAPLLAVLLGALLSACAYAPADHATDVNFPVVEPFAIDRAGSKVSLEFELPDARENGRLRPVYIGFRGVEKKRDYSDQEFRKAQSIMRYMEDAPIPVRLNVWRLSDDGHRTQVVLQEIHVDLTPPHKFAYHPLRGDVVTQHGATSMDNEEMMATGHFDESQIYHPHEFVRIVPPTPGRYLLEAESLETHPVLHDLRYELMVSHYYEKGIY